MATIKEGVHVMNKVFSAIFLLAGFIFVAIGASQVISQHKKIQTYQPVRATILSKSIERHVSRSSKGRTSVTYEPVIQYTYQVSSRNYTNNQVLPINLRSSHDWAQEIIDSYRIGSMAEAYYNPVSPAESFLMRKYLFFPYIFILFPMIFVCLGLYFLLSGGNPDTNPKPPAVTNSTLYKLIPDASLDKRILGFSAIAAVWIIVCGFALYHYYSYASSPYGTAATISAVATVLIASILINLALRNILLQQNIKEPALLVNTPQFKPGDTIRFNINQTLKKELLIETAQLGLVAEIIDRTRSGSRSSTSKSICYENWITLTENYQATPSMPLNYNPTITIPTDQPISTPPSQKGHPRYHWHFEYRIELANSPDLKTKFPIVIA